MQMRGITVKLLAGIPVSSSLSLSLVVNIFPGIKPAFITGHIYILFFIFIINFPE